MTRPGQCAAFAAPGYNSGFGNATAFYNKARLARGFILKCGASWSPNSRFCRWRSRQFSAHTALIPAQNPVYFLASTSTNSAPLRLKPPVPVWSRQVRNRKNCSARIAVDQAHCVGSDRLFLVFVFLTVRAGCRMRQPGEDFYECFPPLY